jgi:hypothetical protein
MVDVGSDRRELGKSGEWYTFDANLSNYFPLEKGEDFLTFQLFPLNTSLFFL